MKWRGKKNSKMNSKRPRRFRRPPGEARGHAREEIRVSMGGGTKLGQAIGFFVYGNSGMGRDPFRGDNVVSSQFSEGELGFEDQFGPFCCTPIEEDRPNGG